MQDKGLIRKIRKQKLFLHIWYKLSYNKYDLMNKINNFANTSKLNKINSWIISSYKIKISFDKNTGKNLFLTL